MLNSWQLARHMVRFRVVLFHRSLQSFVSLIANDHRSFVSSPAIACSLLMLVCFCDGGQTNLIIFTEQGSYGKPFSRSFSDVDISIWRSALLLVYWLPYTLAEASFYSVYCRGKFFIDIRSMYKWLRQILSLFHDHDVTKNLSGLGSLTISIPQLQCTYTIYKLMPW